jgi:hypothetical protein
VGTMSDTFGGGDCCHTEYVDLSWLSASAGSGGVLLQWETGTEISNLGFNIFRSLSDDFDTAAQVNDQLILSQAIGNYAGATYGYTDRTAARDTTYFYWLQDVSAVGAFADIDGYNGVHAFGSASWSNSMPGIVSLADSGVTSAPWQPVQFTATYADPDGADDLLFVELLINDRRSGDNGVWARYYPATGKSIIYMYTVGKWRVMRDDPPTRQNPSAIVELSSVVQDGNALQLTYTITPKGTFLGDWNLYMRARDVAGEQCKFEDMGGWSIAK